MFGAQVNLYVTPFNETNPRAKDTGFTDHRVMMEGLSLWEKFEKLKLRACDEKGNRRPNFDVRKETELFYGFTRKNDVWFSTSCTLNSWIESLTGKEAADVVRQAGARRSDQSKADLINLMPRDLWRRVLPRLEELTAYDVKPWTVNWATEAGSVLIEEETVQFEKDQLN